MEIKLQDPPFGQGVPLFGNVVSTTEFQAVMPHGLFRNVVPNPKRLEGSKAKHYPDLSPVASLRERVQRLVSGAKGKNVEPYARYIIEMVKSGEGFTPQIVLWFPEKLTVEVDNNTGIGYILIPHEMKFVALDGDTQTAARNEADVLTPKLLEKQAVKVVIRHGISEEQAQQIFADCNTKGVKVTTSMAIGLDNRDDATQLTKFIEKSVPTLAGKVNRQKRQLSSADSDVLTMSALRAAVVCFLEGIGGVQNQTRGVAIESLVETRAAALAWFSAVSKVLGPAMSPEQRGSNFAAAPAVWCAIGAIGNDTWIELVGEKHDKAIPQAALEHAFQAKVLEKLAAVDWKRGDHWLTIGAKKSVASGAYTLGGPKESASLVYKALKEGSLVSAAKQAA